MSTKPPHSVREVMQMEIATGTHMNKAAEFGRKYLGSVSDRHVAPNVGDLQLLENFDEHLPESFSTASDILKMLDKYGTPNTMAQTGGRFFGLVNGSVIPASLGARLLADAWDQNSALFALSPINAKIEEVCQKWMIDLFGLPKTVVAGFVSGTSMATVCGIAAARYRILKNQGWDSNKQGLAGAPNIRLVAGRHAHSTVIKSVALLGFGTDRIEWVDVDDQGRLDCNSLPTLDKSTILFLQAGNVNSGSFDPIREACTIANSQGAWVHIDGAFGLWAAASDELNHLTDGIELANSWSVDGHKTLNTPYENGIILCADEDALIRAMQNSASYIMYSDSRDGMLYTPEMSRRARAIDLWAALRFLGREGIDQLVTGLHERAVQFADGLRKADFKVINDVAFNQVMFSVGDEQETERFADYVQKSGEAWVGSSTWFDEPIIRISVCSWVTTALDVSRTIEAFKEARTRSQIQKKL